MKVSYHKLKELWYFTVPVKMSDTGRRKPMYFSTKHKAEDGLADFQREYRQYRGAAMTDKDRSIMTVYRAKYADIPFIEAMEYYKRTHANLKVISVMDAVESFLRRIEGSNLDKDTKSGYRSRLRQFSAYIGDRELHEVTTSHIDKFLQTKREGGDRRSHWKALSPFFKHAMVPEHWIVKNPMDEFSKEQKPRWGEPKREIYTPDQYSKLLTAAVQTDEYVTRYLVIAGTGFFRPEELIRTSASDSVLAWEDIQLDRPFIHVKPEVSKATGRRRRERHVQLEENKTLLNWLQQEMSDNQLTGEILPMSGENFRERMDKVFTIAGVESKHDALRHSSISYYLAMNDRTGVRQVAEWAGNSEATILKHYLQVLRKEQGEQWFGAVSQLIKE